MDIETAGKLNIRCRPEERKESNNELSAQTPCQEYLSGYSYQLTVLFNNIFLGIIKAFFKVSSFFLLLYSASSKH